MTALHFHKMHALGNDFLIINNFQQKNILEPSLIRALADRYQGIGFDQLLLIGPSSQADVDCLIFNADGSEAEQCGNGMRCVARFVHEEKIIHKPRFTINTKAGLVKIEIETYDKICADIGIPKLSPEPITVSAGSTILDVRVLSLGNPHAIYCGEQIKDMPVVEWGALIAKHKAFPQGVNVGFMEVLSRERILLRTVERGAGETRACGSNACAAVVAGISENHLDASVTVELSQGKLQIEWQGENHPVFLTGPAARVFSGILTPSSYMRETHR